MSQTSSTPGDDVPLDKSPAFQFYPADWLSSSSVTTMSLAARGLFITLLCRQWGDGSLPSTVKELRALACVTTTRARHNFNATWKEVCPHFVDRGDGRLINLRLEKERRKQAARRSARSEAGKKGAGVRWNPDGSAINLPLAKNSFTTTTTTSSSISNNNNNTVVPEIPAKRDGERSRPGSVPFGRDDLVESMGHEGVDLRVAVKLLSTYGPNLIERQIRYLRDRKAKDKAATLVASIQGDWKPAA